MNKEEMKTNIRERFKDLPNLGRAMLFYLEGVKNVDLNLKQADELIKKLLRGPKVLIYEKLLNGVSLTGIKPDVYIIPRNKEIQFDFSYHFMRKVVKERYDTDIEVVLFEDKHKSMIKKFDPLNKVLELDCDAYTSLYLEDESFSPKNFAFAAVIATSGKGKDYFLYRKTDLVRASSAYDESGLKKEFSNLSNASIADKDIHKAIQMIKKTAMKFYIRDYFPDVSALDDIDVDTVDWSKSNAGFEEGLQRETESFCERIKGCSSIEELNQIAQEITKSGISTSMKVDLRKVYAQKKKDLVSSVTENKIEE